MFIYLLGFFQLVAFALLLRSIKNKYETINKIYTYLANIIFWNMFLRLFLEGYIEFSISSLMNLYNIRWDSKSDTFSSIFSIIIFAWIIFFPFLVWILLWKNFNHLKDQTQINTIGTIYIELRQDSKMALLYHVFYTLRRLFFSLLVFVFRDQPSIQVQLFVFHCILVIIYIVLCKPFENPVMNRLEIFNELCIIVAGYHLFTFTSFVDSASSQYMMGWSMIGVTIFNIAVNMIVLGY